MIGLGGSQTLTYLLTSFVFILMTLIFKPKLNLEYENEKLKLGVYDLLVSIAIGISSYIFYKIFSNSIIVINEFRIKRVFAIEEVIGASLLLSICATSFREFAIFGFELRNILSILIVLVLGWKNGILVGATSGITIGTVLALMGVGEHNIIASYALSRYGSRNFFKIW